MIFEKLTGREVTETQPFFRINYHLFSGLILHRKTKFSTQVFTDIFHALYETVNVSLIVMRSLSFHHLDAGSGL